MNTLQEDVQELVLGFFRVVGSSISQNDDIYRIDIPDKYKSFFQANRVSITFDEETASKHNCELVIPGSKILMNVIDICTKKGPVVLKRQEQGKSAAIRYHFFVHFSGLTSTSILDHVDVDLGSFVSDIPSTVIEHTSNPLGWLDQKAITPTYSLALDELQKKHYGAKTSFLDDANRRFAEDREMFVKKHDAHVRQLDDAIREKEKNSNSSAKVQKFRFETVEEMNSLEKEKIRLLETLQRKHSVTLEYRLVACEVLTDRQY